MKNGLKRLTAAVLLICTLLSFTVPATFAEDEGTVVASYNFVLDSKIYGTKTSRHLLTQNCYHCSKPVYEHVADNYATYGWTYVEDTLTERLFRESVNWGLRLQDTGKNGWIAFKLNVPKAGTFALEYTSSTAESGTYSAYMFTTQEIGSGTVAEKMAEAPADNLVGTITKSNSTTDEFGSWNFSAAGEYIVVLKLENTKEMRLGSLRLVTTSEQPEPPAEETTAPTEPSTEPTEPEVEVLVNYDFILYNPQQDDGYNNMFEGDKTITFANKCACGCDKTTAQHIADLYSSGKLNWMMLETTEELSNLQYRTESGWGLRVKSPSKDGWTAFKLQVLEAGTFNLRYTAAIQDGSGKYSAYLFPASLVTGTVAELMAGDVSEYKLGQVSVNSSSLSGNFGNYNFEAAGEYIVVLQHENTQRINIGALTLTVPEKISGTEPIPATDKLIYEFDLSKDDAELVKKGPAHTHSTAGRVRTLLETMFAEGKSNWKFEINSTDFGSTGSSFREGCFRFKVSTKNYRDMGDVWYGFRIKNPGTATYDIRINVPTKGMLCANIYLIPAEYAATMSEKQIKDAMTSENMLVKGAIFDDAGTYYLGEHTFGMNTEYVLVFELLKGNLFHIGQIQMTRDGLVADGQIKKEKYYNGTVYDFDLADPMNGIFTDSKVNMADVVDTLNARWASGVSNWNWEASCDDLMGTSTATASLPKEDIRFYKTTGLRYYMTPDDWTAFRIKSPGSGTFTLSLNHAIQHYAGTMAIYILPGDTEDIFAAMDHSNRVGNVILYNDGTATTTDGITSFVGYWDFEAGKEYIVVIEAYAASPYNSSFCYMNFSQLICERGKIDYTTEEEKNVMPVMVAENLVPAADPRITCLITQVGGHDYYVIPMEGGVCLVYDLDTRELVTKFNLGYTLPAEVIQDPDGIIWISGPTAHLVRYDPFTNTVYRTQNTKKIPGLEHVSGYFTMEAGNNGDIYLGCGGGATLAVYNHAEKRFRVIGSMLESGGTIRGMTRYGDYLYFAVYNSSTRESVVCKFNILTETLEATCDISEASGYKDGTGSYPQSVCVLGNGDLLAVGGNSSSFKQSVTIDPATMELVDSGLPTGYNLYVSAPYNGKNYFVLSGNYGMYEYDIATKTFAKTVGIPSGLGFRSKGSQVVTLDGEELLMTFSNTGAAPKFYNMETKEYTGWDDLVVHADGGSYCRSLIAGPEGSNELYFGAYNNNTCAIFNTELGKITGYYKTGGQGDSQIWYEGKLYAGNYSSTTLNEIAIQDKVEQLPANNEIFQRWRLDHDETEQKRVHTLAAGDGYVFAGTIPDTSLFGGAVVVYDTRTGRWFYERNVVQDQAVIDVEYYDKLLFGSTSTYGGSKAVNPDPNASAKIFVYDYENRKVIATMDPRDYISGINVPIGYIGGFTADPIVEGRFWAVVSETLFAFTFDKETLKFNVQEVISWGKNSYSTSSSRPTNSREVRFNPETKQMYFCFDSNGGMRCIELVDFNAPVGSIKIAKTERLTANFALKYNLSEQGDLYYSYASGGDLYMMPLNVTEEDWQIAEAVDQMILALGKEITLENEAAIKEARSAYDNLSWRYKALVQELDRLLECEVELLERKIDPIVLEDVTADTLPLLQEYMDTYNAMNTRQQNYVKNYNHLLESYNQASILNDQRVAAAMQERINALKDKFPLTLDNEPEVVQLRDDYDALTTPQRILVDITILEEAEAQIKVLRAEFVKYVETLIQAIPAEITLDAEPAITTAREAADKLYVSERKEVSYSKLTSAEGKLRTLQKAKAAADEVDALISEIGIVTLGDKDRIAAAREAYDALKDAALQFVTKGKKLETAEFILKALQSWGIPVITIVNAALVVALVPSLRKKIFKGKKNAKIEEL